MEASSSSTPKRKKLNEFKEAAIQSEYSGLKRKIERKYSGRKKKEKLGSGSNTCHQCKRNDRGRIVGCLNCKKRRYCVHCITKWYPMMSENDFELACPVCKHNCNCINCLRLEDPLMPIIPSKDNISVAKQMLKTLLPFMRQIHEEQKKEKMREAKIQGVSLLQLKIGEGISQLDEHVYCGNCKTYIPDLHRSCTHCSFNLCLICCREVFDGCLQGVQEEEIMQFLDPGEEYLHGAEKYIPISKEGRTLGRAHENRCEDLVKLKSEWKLDENKNIPCLSKDMGGCGNGILVLKHILSEDYISSLFWRANALSEQHNLRDMPETPMQCCTCPNSCDSNSSGNVRRAGSCENSNDNYLYSPTAVNIKDADLKHFQSHFFRGEPIIVNNVLEKTCGLSWEPLVIRRAFRQLKRKEHPPLKNVAAINCLDWCKVDTEISLFFEGYQKGGFGKDGYPQILQLTDWPPSAIFNQHVPRHSWEFIRSLPFKEYTHPYRGNLNLAAMPSAGAQKPDLGPKMSISYGVAPELGRGDSVTKLRYNKCDTVNVLMHVQPISLTMSQLDMIKSMKKMHFYQDQLEIYGNDKIRNVTEKQLEGENAEEFKNTDGGAVWDIFCRDDISKLESYLKKHFKEFRHVNCRPVEKVVHPIHDQIFYLSMEHKRRLKAEYGIEPWSFVQQLGDAVFVPAGCPYQVRDIKSCMKVSVGFVSPENVRQCIQLAEEIRVLPQHHRAKEDILEVKKLIIRGIKQSVNELEKLNAEPTLYAEDSFQLSKSPNSLPEDSHGFLSLRSDTDSMTCTSDEDVEDCSQGPSAREEEAPTEKCGEEDPCGGDSFTSKVTSEKQIVPYTTGWAQSTHTQSAMCTAPNISHRTPMSLPAETVSYFKQLADMLQGDKFDQILPPQIELDEQTICEYEQVLKKGMNGDLRELGKGSRYQEFNQVLTALLSCRRIPSSLYREFLSLRRDLPSLASKAVELEKEVTGGILQRDNRSIMKQLETYMNRYRNCEDNLVKLEEEKAFNLSEIERLQSRNQAIDSEITNFTAEADTLRKASAAESHKVVNLDGVGAVDESTLQRSMADLQKMESEWRKRVALLRF